MQNNLKPTLWIVGDSFSHINQEDICEDTWHLILPKTLNFDLHNYSQGGTAQDWAWRNLRDWQFEIKPEDQLIVVLTHPSRFWFFEDRPDVSNHNIIDFDYVINDKERALAAKYFIQYIQRPELDIQALDHKMGWLSNLVYKNNWKKPLIIKAFEQSIYTDLYPNLIFSNGSLYDVSVAEGNRTVENRHTDTRYNHLCLSNHKILAEKITNTITTGCELDLTTGFRQNIYTKELLENPKQTELSPAQLQIYNTSKPINESWLTRLKS